MRAVSFLVAAAVLAACQSKPPEPPPKAVTDLSGKVCDSKVSLVDAIALTPKKAKAWQDIFTQVTAETPCIGEADASANYVVYALPDHGPNHVITIGGLNQVQRTLAPKVMLLDWNGEVTRAFGSDKFQYHGENYSVQFRPSEDDRYILVETDPELVGETETGFETRLVMGQGTVATPTGSASYTTYSGREGATWRTFSHEGVVSVRIQAVNGKIGQPAG